MKKSIAALFLLVLAFSCDKTEEEPTPSSSSSSCIRTGAVCKDGTTSTATGSGACSGHDGVDHWICK
jgi:hypothetical protein